MGQNGRLVRLGTYESITVTLKTRAVTLHNTKEPARLLKMHISRHLIALPMYGKSDKSVIGKLLFCQYCENPYQ